MTVVIMVMMIIVMMMMFIVVVVCFFDRCRAAASAMMDNHMPSLATGVPASRCDDRSTRGARHGTQGAAVLPATHDGQLGTACAVDRHGSKSYYTLPGHCQGQHRG